MIIHFTTVHGRRDIRILVKEAATLRRRLQRDVRLLVLDGLPEERDRDSDVLIQSVGARPSSRIIRMTRGCWRMYRAIRRARPEVAHFHDPELIPVGILLRMSGIKVVYDVHEDVPGAILSKQYIPKIARHPLSFVINLLERIAAKFFSAIVAATPAIAERFSGPGTTVVQNFPLLDEFAFAAARPMHERGSDFAYVGGLTAVRGTSEMVAAIALVKNPGSRLHLAGQFSPSQLQLQTERLPGWSRINFKGLATRTEVGSLLGSVRAGLVVFHPEPNHILAQPNKLFEYMAAGLPVIASDFPLWRDIVGTAGAGLLVDPSSPVAISEAMQWMLDHPAEAQIMGENGRAAVINRFNWERESAALITLYKSLLGDQEKGNLA
ncbi:RfaG Glycosyltransferase [Paracoccaceae bacterium]